MKKTLFLLAFLSFALNGIAAIYELDYYCIFDDYNYIKTDNYFIQDCVQTSGLIGTSNASDSYTIENVKNLYDSTIPNGSLWMLY